MLDDGADLMLGYEANLMLDRERIWSEFDV